MSSLKDKVIVTKENGVGQLTLNQPDKRNAISYEMWETISDTVEMFSSDKDVLVVVIRGSGKESFSAGADISQFSAKRSTTDTTAEYDSVVSKALDELTNLAKPSIAMIYGYCVGGGVSVAMHCDIRLASKDASFSIPAAKLGLAYGSEDLRLLVQLVGPAFAREILYTARQFTAAEALSMGLINRVVPKEDLKSCVEEYTSNISANAPLTIYAIKQTIQQILKDPDKQDPDHIAQLIAKCFSSKDYQEGREAFLQKRKPIFKGH